MSILKINGGVIASNKGSEFTSNVRSFIDSRLHDKDLNTINMFSTNYYGNLASPYTYSATGANFVRSLSCWGSDLNSQLTSVSVFAGNPIASGGKAPNRQRFTLITPRHAIAAKHYVDGAAGSSAPSGSVNTYSASQRIWIDSNNNPVEGFATHWAQIGTGGDGVVLVLDRVMPTSINRMPIANVDILTKMWASDRSKGIPLISTDQFDRLSVREINTMPTSYANGQISFQQSKSSLRSAFYRDAVPGDSSNPTMIVYNNIASLMSAYYTGGGGAGPAYYCGASEINAAIATVDAAAGISTGYTVTVADFG